jgi:hypothetical protein
MTSRNPRRDPRLATAFASFVCAWALLFAVLALSGTERADAASDAPIVAAVQIGR